MTVRLMRLPKNPVILLCLLLTVAAIAWKSLSSTAAATLTAGSIILSLVIYAARLKQALKNRIQALQTAKQSFCVFDDRMRLLDWNDAFEALYGLKAHRNHDLAQSLPQAAYLDIRQQLSGSLDDDTIASTVPLKRESGPTLWVRQKIRQMDTNRRHFMLVTEALSPRSAPDVSQSGNTHGISRYIQDLINVLPQPIFVRNGEGHFIMANDAFIRSMKPLTGDPNGKHLREVFTDARLTQRILDEDQDVLHGQVIFREALYSEHGGTDQHLIVSKNCCTAPDGQKLIVGTYIDVTTCRQAEHDLQAALDREVALRTRTQEFLQRLVDVIPQPVYVKDAGGRYTLVNQAFCQESQCSRDTLIGHRSHRLSADLAHETEEDHKILSGERVHREECCSHSSTGEESFRLITKGSCLDAEGRPVIVGCNFDVTPWRQAERSINETLQQQMRLKGFLQTVFDTLPTPIFIKDEQLRYVMVNQAAAALCHRSVQSLLGMSLRDTLEDSEAERIESRERELLTREDGTTLQYESSMQSPSGAIRHFITNKAVSRDACNEHVIITSLMDVSAIRNAEAGLQAALTRETLHRQRTQEFVQRLIDVIPEPVYVKDAQSCYLLVNDAFARNFAVSKAEIRGLDSIERIGQEEPGKDRRIREEDLAVLAGKTVLKEEHYRRPETGEEGHRIISKAACLNAEGNPVIVIASFDITRWYQAEQKLTDALEREQQSHESTLRYIQRLIDVIPYPVSVKDDESRFILVNTAFAKERMLPKEQLPGMSVTAIACLDEASRKITLEEDAQVLKGEVIFKEEYKPHAVTGAERYRVISKASCDDPSGKRVIVVATFDVTPWRLAERELAAALQRETEHSARIKDYVQRLIDVIPQPVYVKDASSRYLMVNEAFAVERGLPKEDIVGKLSARLPDTQKAVFAEDASVLAGNPILKEEFRPHPETGQPRYRVIAKGSCVDDEGNPIIVGANFDVTPWRLAEARLFIAKEEAERANTAKTLFLTNMSHELRTPMHGILSFARIGLQRVSGGGNPERLASYFERIVNSAERLMTLLDDLLDLAKLEAGRTELKLSPTDIRTLIQEVRDEFEALASAHNVHIVPQLEGPAAVRADPKLLGQVLRNLLSNAIKFSPENGEIRISVQPGVLNIQGNHLSEEALELIVADQGPGIPEPELEAVFDKFFQSTKTRDGSGGTGLGLAISREIATAHGGQIFARNRSGGGAEFVLRIPVDGPATLPQPAAASQ